MATKKTVLVVDDEPGVLRFVSVSLNLAGYEVITTTCGKEGLELARAKSPDVMLLDVLMFPFSGFDVLASLREFSKLPVIVFTGRDDIADQALRAGASGYIAKPFLPEQLLKKIKETLGEH